MANSTDSDQTPRSAASDLVHCLQKPICPNTKGYYANVPVHKWSSYQYEKLAKLTFCGTMIQIKCVFKLYVYH